MIRIEITGYESDEELVEKGVYTYERLAQLLVETRDRLLNLPNEYPGEYAVGYRPQEKTYEVKSRKTGGVLIINRFGQILMSGDGDNLQKIGSATMFIREDSLD